MSSAPPTDPADPADPADPGALLLRPATSDDTDAICAVHLGARRTAEAAGHMPPAIHPDADVRRWLAQRIRDDDTWVAELRGVVVGYARMTSEWLDDLYVVPERQGRGVGTALLDLARALRPGGFGLYVFETNLSARGFYDAHGLVEVDHGDPCGNEEGVPDRMLVWPGRGGVDVGAAWQHRAGR